MLKQHIMRRQNMNLLRIGFVTVMAIAVSVGAVWAQQGQSGQADSPRPIMQCEEQFKVMDSNQDGLVTAEEFLAVGHKGMHSSEVFQTRDENDDGALSKEEFCAGKGAGGKWRK
jgi:hypothetical protein